MTKNLLKTQKEKVNSLLTKYLSLNNCKSRELIEAMRYTVLNGGKRLRPLLVYAIGTAYGANWKKISAPACAVEMIHCFSLIHDDLPSMDNDDLRRGKLTCHKVFGEATAILAGDALLALSLQILNQSKYLNNKQIILMTNILTKSIGCLGMAGGQALDIKNTKTAKLTIKQIKQLYLLKTGALIEASIQLGAISAENTNKNILKLLSKLATDLSLAFQLQDDILDIEGTKEVTGKTPNTDKKLSKITIPKLIGLEKTKFTIKKLYNSVYANLQNIEGNTKILKIIIDNLRARSY